MQRNIMETVLGAVVLLVAVGFIVFAKKIVDKTPDNGYVITAKFSNVDGLNTGSPVNIGGVTIGKVTELTLDSEKFVAIVKMNIDGNIKLPLDTAAIVSSAGLLGGKVMSLEPGFEEETIQNNGEIEYTQSSPSLEKMLGQVIFSITKGDDTKEDDKAKEE